MSETAHNPNTHGGAGRGQGRKPLDADDPTERHNLTAPASIWRLLERLGDGNRSEGLRILRDMLRYHEPTL